MVVATLNMIRIDRRLRESLQMQIYHQIRLSIISGALRAGVRLPSTRDLTQQLGVSRNTIVYGFDRLVAEGYLEGRRGSGIYVAELQLTTPAQIAESPRQSPGLPRRGARLTALSEVSISPSYIGAKIRPFRPCQPAIDCFPLRNWNRARSYALRLHAGEVMCEVDASGLPRLRRALAAYLRDSRGVHCEAEQIVITAGTQEALSLIAELLIEGGDRVWIEDPGYLGARAVFSRSGAKLVPISVDEAGITIPILKRKPRLIYTTPSRQFPRGVTMSLTRRLALLEFARSSGAWIIEDDYDSEFRFVGRPAPSLQGLDSHSCVIYLGSFSKVLFASLRLGYAVLPQHLVDPFRKLKEISSGSVSAVDQATAAVFIEEGFFATHVRRMRNLYGERRDAFLHEAKKYLSGVIEFSPIDAGMDAFGSLRSGDSDADFSNRFRAAGVDAPPLSVYSLRPCEPGLVLGFTAFSPAQIRLAMQSLSNSFH
jgi:GntR family transcriptional regulator / MocR family aminotransferase